MKILLSAITALLLSFHFQAKNENNDYIKIEREGSAAKSVEIFISTKRINVKLTDYEKSRIKAEIPHGIKEKYYVKSLYTTIVTDKISYLKLLNFIKNNVKYYGPINTMTDGLLITLPDGHQVYLTFNNIHPFYRELTSYLSDNKCDKKLISEFD